MERFVLQSTTLNGKWSNKCFDCKNDIWIPTPPEVHVHCNLPFLKTLNPNTLTQKNVSHGEMLWEHITVNLTPFCLSNLLFSVEQSQERVCWTSVRISLVVDIHRVVVPQNPWWPWLLPVIRCNCKSWQFLTAKWPIKMAKWSDLPVS